jgi:hypothetical protein
VLSLFSEVYIGAVSKTHCLNESGFENLTEFMIRQLEVTNKK